MSSFSERKGLKPIRSLIQINSADSTLRNHLWNGLIWSYWDDAPQYMNDNTDVTNLLLRTWIHFYGGAVDKMSKHCQTLISTIRETFMKGSWNEMYDMLEFIPNNFGTRSSKVNKDFRKYANDILAQQLSAYRFVDSLITDITSDQELESIEQALTNEAKYKAVNEHMRRAVELFSDRKNPDYRNSIKESISAVESLCSIFLSKPKATLGQALAELEKSHGLHSALKSSFASLYGWTSDAEGIRHKMMDQSAIPQEDAKFMLITCSAFINYVLSKATIA